MSEYRTSGYRYHWVCLKCRVGGHSQTCSRCHQATHNMGVNFRTPRHNAVAQWKKIEYLIETETHLAPNYMPRNSRGELATIQSIKRARKERQAYLDTPRNKREMPFSTTSEKGRIAYVKYGWLPYYGNRYGWG